MRSESKNSVARLKHALAVGIILAALPIALGSARGDSGVCGPFDTAGDFSESTCAEPGVTGAEPSYDTATGALHGSDVPPGTEIVPLPESLSLGSGAATARDNEALLALPKRANGTVPTDFQLAPGATIEDSFFSPVLCSTVARVVGDGSQGPAGLVIQLPDGAQVFPHSVYQMAANEVVAIGADSVADALDEERAAAAAAAEQQAREAAPAPPARPDPYREFQYGLSAVDIERAWTVSDGTGATVAVLDSLPDRAHVDLPSFQVALGEVEPGADGSAEGGAPDGDDARDSSASSADDPDATTAARDGPSVLDRPPGVHGTLMAGVIAADTGNGVGISGLAPGASLLSVPVCAADGPEDCGLYDILRGIDTAWENSADVVNLSLVGPSNPLLARAVSRLERLGVLVVAAAGNEGTREPRYPAAYDSVIGVGAVDRDRRAFERSNRGLSVELAAPGVSVLSTIPGDSFAFASGTSLAAAHVSGSLAVLVGAEIEPERARAALLSASAPNEEGTPVTGSLCDALDRAERGCR